MYARIAGSRGSPHSSHSPIVSGMVGSSMELTASTNGTSATTALQQAARGQAAGDDRVARHPLAGGQRVGGRDEVGERSALVIQPTLQPPPPPALAAAPDVRDRVQVAAV